MAQVLTLALKISLVLFMAGNLLEMGLKRLDGRDKQAVFELTQGAVATSGRTHRGLHIIDPATGAPAGRLLTATVLGASLMWADVYATAAVVKGDAAIGWLESLADHEGVVVADDGTCHVTSSLV